MLPEQISLTKEEIAEKVYASADKGAFLLPLVGLYRLWGNERGGGMLENALARFIHDLERPDLIIKTHWERPHRTVRVLVSVVYEEGDV